jgi:hypothetical protein
VSRTVDRALRSDPMRDDGGVEDGGLQGVSWMSTDEELERAPFGHGDHI